MTRETIKEAYGLSEYVDEKIKALEQRAEKAMSDKRCCITSVTPQQQLCEDVISREVTLNYIRDNYRRWFINDDAFMQCVNGIKDIAPVTPQQGTGRWIDAEVLDKIRAEIEHMIPCSKEALSMKLGVLEIIDKYKAESEDKE